MSIAAGLVGLLFLTAFSLLPLHWVSVGAAWVSLLIAFVAIPLLDAWVGPPRRASPPSGTRARFDVIARWLPRVHLLLQSTLLIQAVCIAPSLSWSELFVFGVAVGTVTGGLGITVAHELAHRASLLDRIIAKALLVMVGYGHFVVEHVRGHHVRVGTPEDPATAPRGMSVYRFIVRSVIGSFVHAWRLEAMRLQHDGRSAFSAANWTLTGSVLAMVLLVLAAWIGGAKAASLFAFQAGWAIVLLEIINYIEHYGLQRKRAGDRYEAVREGHSWNADFTVSNWILFNLQLHSDHHANMQRPYEQLRYAPMAPQLPAGYPAMTLLALIPPAWFAVMDRRIAAHS
ncbi:MAG: alkane 1-monooxygenase [Burkholderiaceae bacterium]|nr:alkane 1-monooxygenase [Burkholderiaceae bacterium]